MARRKQLKTVCEGAQLDIRLNDYSAVTRVSADAVSLRSRIGNWPIYAAAAGSALAMATGASASIITGSYTGASVVQFGPNATAGGASIKGLFLGFCPSGPATANCQNPVGLFRNTAAGVVWDEVNIRASGFFPGVSASGVSPVKIFGATTNGTLVRNFAPHSLIGPGLPNAANNFKIVGSFTGSNVFGNFLPGQSGYLGFSVNYGGNVNFGWVKLQVTGIPGLTLPMLQSMSFGLETTPGQSIGAGQTVGATPEPGTMALSLLAAGAAGVLALRRRRKETSGA